MGLLSPSQTIIRYRVDKPGPEEAQVSPMQRVRAGLITNAIPEEKSEFEELVTGWAPYEKPYVPNFDKHGFVFGTYFLFLLRVDKKTVPAKAVAEQLDIAIQAKLDETEREFLPKNEKAEIKAIVMEKLLLQVPFVPATYEVVWDYENNSVLFFTGQKSANELFESLFIKSFNMRIFQIFPYTLADRDCPALLDRMHQTAPMAIGRAS